MSEPLPLCRACGAELRADSEACICCGAVVPRESPRRGQPTLLFAFALFWELAGLAGIVYGGYRFLLEVFSLRPAADMSIREPLTVFAGGVVAVGIGCFLLLVRRHRQMTGQPLGAGPGRE